ncbi:hypothetical protein [Sphingobium vermicomposti]|nr:hypothetical protein [Sphingobium vermicomposti]
MKAAMLGRMIRMVEARAERRRRAVASAAISAGVEDAWVEGESVRLTGRGLVRRWMSDLGLREAGRGSG